MTSRRRARRDRRRMADHPRPAKASPELSSNKRRPDRKRADFERSQARIKRTRSFVGLLGFLPLGISIFCSSGGPGPCSVPREIYLAVWAAIFGTFLGLTVRLWRERRAYERETRAA